MLDSNNFDRFFYYFNYSLNEAYIPGGRTLFLPLELGDTVSLNCHRCNAAIVFTTLCVSLTTPDIVF